MIIRNLLHRDRDRRGLPRVGGRHVLRHGRHRRDDRVARRGIRRDPLTVTQRAPALDRRGLRPRRAHHRHPLPPALRPEALARARCGAARSSARSGSRCCSSCRSCSSAAASRNPLYTSFASLIALLLWLNLSAQVILIAGAYIVTGVAEESRPRPRALRRPDVRAAARAARRRPRGRARTSTSPTRAPRRRSERADAPVPETVPTYRAMQVRAAERAAARRGGAAHAAGRRRARGDRARRAGGCCRPAHPRPRGQRRQRRRRDARGGAARPRRRGRAAARVGPVPRARARGRDGGGRAGGSTCSEVRDTASRYDVSIDGILGIGSSASSALRGTAREVVEALLPAVRGGRPRVIAVDLPSGLHPDTGEADDVVLPAAVTVTFGAVKAGLVPRARARARAASVVLVDLGLGHGLADEVPAGEARSPGSTGRSARRSSAVSDSGG